MAQQQILILLCLALTSPIVRAYFSYRFQVREHELLPLTLGRIPTIENGTVVFVRNIDPLYVNVNVSTGIVSTISPIDREEIESIRCFIVNEFSKQSLSQIIIDIIDVNDHYPEFHPSTKQLSISEFFKVGHSLSLLTPVDKDSGYNGMISNVTLQNNESRFSIVYNKKDSKYFSLVLEEPLDREDEPFIVIELLTTDCGSPSLSSKAIINITVQDINDNHPVFPNTNMFLSISEATEVNSSLTSINATDLDDGDNAEISYTLTSSKEYLGDNYFMIDSHTGVVRLIQRLLYEQNTFFDLTITAKDHGSPSLSSTASLRISITDSNNHPSTISIPKQHLTIKEHNPIGQFLTYVTIHDEDSVEGNFSLKLLNYNSIFTVKPFQLNKKIDQTSKKAIRYYLTIEQSIEYTSYPYFELNLKATDGLYEAYAKLFIDVENINNHPPNFDQQNYVTEFYVRSPEGSYVATMHATDTDFSDGGNITYNLAPLMLSNHFNISYTGVILLTKPLPLDQVGFINLTISASDHQTPTKQTFGYLSMKLVSRKSPCQPKISTYPRKIQLDRAELSKTIAAYPTENNCLVLYSLQTNVAETVFTINEQGELYFHEMPTKHDQSVNLTITAYNIHNLHYTDTISTIITFIDEKITTDHVEFEKPFYFLQLKSDAKVGDFVTRVVPVPMTTAKYFIEGETNNFLRIDNDGRIYIMRRLNTVNMCNVYMIKAMVNLTKNISTILMHSTESASALTKGSGIFMRDIFSFTVKEHSPKGWIIGKIRLAHPITNSRHFYIEPAETSRLFKIDNQGYLKLDQSLRNVNTKTVYKLVITLTTNCSLYRVPVQVRVEHLNDHTPYFTSPNFAQLNSSHPTIHPVYHATARDLDTAQNGELIFQLTQNGNGYFCMDQKSGDVYLTRRIPSKEQKIFVLKMRVLDRGQPQRSSTKTVHLIWNGNLNNERQTRMNVQLNETILGKGFLQLPAPDRSYSIESHSDIFGIYPNKWIYTKTRTLEQHYYKLLISEVGGVNQNQNKQNGVIVYITTNSSKPRQIFDRSIYDFVVSNDYTGVAIANISLSTNDNKTVLYLPEANDYVDFIFTSHLLLKSKLDYELLRETNCQIIFPVNGVRNGVRETSVVKLKAMDRNNHGPRFISDHVTYELSSKGSHVIPSGVLEVRDRDLRSEFMFSIKKSNCCSVARINSTDGEIRFANPLNGSCVMIILVLDTDVPSKNDTTELLIYNIYQKDIHLPSDEKITLNVSENVPLGTVLYQYPHSAGDFDFKIKSISSTHFLVHPSTGSVIVAREMDYEQQRNHSLLLLINDKTNIEILVNVLNENDNPPVPKEEHVKLTIQDDMPVGSVFSVCTAKDLDRDVLQYSIDWKVMDVENQFFHFYKNNCSLKLKENLIELAVSEREVQISISDGVHLVKIDVSLTILRVSAPRVLSPSACLVPSNADNGSLLYQIEVQKSYLDQIKEYSIEKGLVSHLFIVNSTGRLQLRQNWPNQHNYIILNILVKTKAGIQTTFKLLLFKEVDGDLSFESDTYFHLISENKDVDYNLQVRVRKPSNGIVYHTVSGQYAYCFKVDENTGQISIPTPIDREMTGPRIDMNIYAIDMRNYQTACTEYSFFIDGVNDNAPHFWRHPSEVWVQENEINRKILKFNVTDFDEGDIVSYKITSGNDLNLFKLQTDGSLVVGDIPLDYEEQIYILEVVASDNGSPSLETKTTIKIYVTDQNDHTPSFSEQQPYFEIFESLPVGSLIGNITATDLDSDRNGAVQYKIVTGDYGYFNMDPSTSRIYLVKPLRCIDICAFYIEIEAEDHGSPSKWQRTSIVINIIPENEQILSKNQYNVTVPYYLSMNSKVTQLEIAPSKFLYGKKIFFSIVDDDGFWISEGGAVYLKHEIPYEANHIQMLVRASRNKCTSDFELATISIEILRDNRAPSLSSIRDVFFVVENSVIGSTIGHVTAVGEGEIVYQLAGSNTANLPFTMSSNGSLILTKQTDFEKKIKYLLEIEAFFKNKPSQKTRQAVYIFVVDVNDNYPLFNHHSPTINISTNHDPSRQIFQIHATDLDSGDNGKLEYRLLNYTDVFRIDANRGSVFIINETFKHGDFRIGVEIRDSGENPKSNSTSVLVKFLESKIPTRFKKCYHKINVTENQAPIAHLYKFDVVDEDHQMVTSKQYSFRILATESVLEKFSIQNTTGVLSQLKSVDREQNPGFEFHIVLHKNHEEVDRALVKIEVLDLNDNPPEISKNMRASISEHSPKGTFIMSVKAVDKDTGPNGRLQYALGNYQSEFEIDNHDGSLTMKKDLDHEIQSRYDLVVIIQDSTPPHHLVKSTIAVNIEDINDEPPKFITSSSEIIIPPGSPIGTYLTTLQASDADTPVNSRMVFTSNDSMISIDQHLDIVILSKPTDSSFSFQANVSDPTKPNFKDTITIKIHIQIGSFPTLKKSNRYYSIVENDDFYLHNVIHRLGAVNKNDNLRFDIVPKDRAEFRINQTSGKLFLRKTLDYESQRFHIIWVSVWKIDSPTFKSHQRVTVFVINTNDNIPTFEQNETMIPVREDSINRTIGRFEAFDFDEGDKIFYFLSPPYTNNGYTINHKTGVIERNLELDFETTAEYNLTIYATNDPTGNSEDRSQMFVNIRVLNVNDEPPRFVNPPERIEIPENFTISALIDTFNAVDDDNLSPITFTTNFADYFKISPTGQLSLIKSLDREVLGTNQSLTFTINDGVHSTNHSLTLTIEDVNDSPPQFSATNFTIEFPEKTKIGEEIFYFRVQDADEGQNAISKLEMVTTDPDINQIFKLHNNGSLVTRKNLTIKGQPIRFNLIIKATNMGSPYFRNTANVIIEVLDLNDHAPVFEQNFYKGHIQADAPLGETVLRVNANDNMDIGPNALINYSIVNGKGSSFFSIDSNGNLNVTRSLQSLVGQTVLLTIQAKDNGDSPLSSTCVTSLTIEQINIHQPQVYGEPYLQHVLENQTMYEQVLRIKADDVESKVDLKFQMVNAEDNSPWFIHNNGSIFLRVPLDYETQTNYTLMIKITDSSNSNPKSVMTVVELLVGNINDEPPVFDQVYYSVCVPENFDITNPLLKVHAEDADSINTVVSYSIQNPTFNFGINATSGDLFSMRTFNYEHRSSYILSIEASDSGSPIMKSVVKVTINITGINEYKPRFDAASYFFNISRRRKENEVLGKVTASDRDQGLDGESFYKIAAPLRNGIAVNPISGDLTIYRRPLPQLQEVRILVFNKNKQSFFDQTQVRVDVFDFTGAPVFENDVYRISVYENEPIQNTVFRVTANYYGGDKDGLSYGLVSKIDHFSIDLHNGDIILETLLDYEQTILYQFQIFAKYGNLPEGFAQVQAHVLDFNDNPPRASNPICVGNVTENTAPDFTIIQKISVTDADGPHNGAPFHFSLNDNAEKFEIDESSGMVRNRLSLDREEQPVYNISIRIADSGTPPLSTLYNCIININDVNDNQGTSRRADIIASQDSFPKIGFGDVSPIDPDSNDKYSCELEDKSNLLVFDTYSCFLTLKKSKVSEFPDSTTLVYFGQHRNEERIKSSVTIKTRELQATWFQHNVALLVSNMNEDQFISSHFYRLETYLNEEFADKLASSPTIMIASVKNIHNGVIVVLLPNRETKQNEDLLRYHLKQSTVKLAKLFGTGHNVSIFDACEVNGCQDTSMVCKSQLVFTEYVIQETNNLILHGRDFNIKKQCLCPAGRVGVGCSKIPERCSDLPCQASGRCENLQNGVLCHCPDGLTGNYCEFDVNECLSSPCQQGSTCVNKYGGFFCVCDENHEGKTCEKKKSPCSYNPCYNNGQCLKSLTSESNYECKCGFGDWGSRCEKQSWNFGPASWVEIIANRSSSGPLRITGEFATIQKDSLLAWTVNKDWVLAVHISDGKLSVSMVIKQKMTSSIVLDNEVMVMDGLFHTFEVRLDEKEMILKVDDHEISRRVQTKMKETNNLTDAIYIGGVKRDGDIESLQMLNLSSVEFIGCMRRLNINGAPLNGEILYQHSDGVTLGCKRKENVCEGDICGYGNKCIDRWSHFECRCRQDGILANGCLRDDKSVRFWKEGRGISVRLTDSERRKMRLQQVESQQEGKNKRKRRNQFMEFYYQERSMTNNLLAIQFRTRKDGAILFNSTDVHGMTLISFGKEQVHYSFTTKKKDLNRQENLDHRVNDGQWHEILLKAQPRSVELTFDGNQTKRYTFKGDIHNFFASSVENYLFGEAFSGCFGKIQINDHSFVLGSSNSVFEIDKPSSIERGCMPSDVCSHRPCVNNALNYCVDIWESFKCVKPGVCLERKCENGGRCIPKGLSSFSCDCTRTQYGGKSCQIPLACLDNPCSSKEKCLANGPTYQCVAMETKESKNQNIGLGILIAIVVASIFVLIIFAIGIGCLSSKRRWKEKEFRVDMFKEGFENDAVEHYHHPIMEGDESYGTDHPNQQAVLPHRHRRSKKTSHSLPELRERPFSILKNRYKSAQQFHHQSRKDKGSLDDVYENDLYNNSYPHPPPQGESGFNSSYSEGESSVDEQSSVYYSTSAAQVELYDIERASMQFSEMSFKYNPPIKNNAMETLRHVNQGYVSDSSDAYFTSSEFEYGKRNVNRRNPAFILNEQNKRNLKHCKSDHGGRQSEPDTWSYGGSTLSKGKQTLELREKILREQLDKKTNRNGELEKSEDHISEAEEFV